MIDLLLNIGGFAIGMLAGILFITNILVTILFQIPFLKKLRQSKIINGINWIPQIRRLVLAAIVLVGLVIIPSAGIKIGLLFAFFGTIRLVMRKDQRNTVYLDLVDKSIIKDERYVINDPYDWEGFVSVIQLIDGSSKYKKLLEKNLAIINQRISDGNQLAAAYCLTVPTQIHDIANLIELNEILRDDMLHSPASEWGEMAEREAVLQEGLINKILDEKRSLEEVESKLNSYHE